MDGTLIAPEWHTHVGESGGEVAMTYFFNFCQSTNLRAFTGTQPSLRGMAHRPSVVRSTFHCLLFRSLFFAFLPGSSRDTCTHFTPPERALLRVKGFCGASGEATARGVNLYEDMAAAC